MFDFRRRYSKLLAFVLLAPILAACAATEGPQTTLVPQGDSARAILSLYNVFLIASIVVFVIVEGLLVYSAIRYRRRPGDGIPIQIHGNKPVEIMWTIIPSVIVLFLATMTFRTQAILVQPDQQPVRVTVVGHQWWWEFRYPEYNIVTANELHLPAGRTIEFQLQSADVIHSFWFPRLAGKTDTVPGHTNLFQFTTDPTNEPLLIRGECAEFCGGTHAQMGMFAVVEPQAQFDAWVRAQQADAVVPAGVVQQAAATATAGATAEAATAAPAEVAAAAPAAGANTPEGRGYAIFNSKGCVGCHVIGGRPDAVGQVGPDLTHVGSRRHIVAGWLENNDQNMARWLRDPNEVKPDNIMGSAVPRGFLNEDEIAALTAYLRSLK